MLPRINSFDPDFFSLISRRHDWDVTKNWSRFPTSSLPIHGETVSEVVDISVGIDVLDQPELTTFSTISSRIDGLEVGNRLQLFVTSQSCRLLIREQNWIKNIVSRQQTNRFSWSVIFLQKCNGFPVFWLRPKILV